MSNSFGLHPNSRGNPLRGFKQGRSLFIFVILKNHWGGSDGEGSGSPTFSSPRRLVSTHFPGARLLGC